MKQNWKIFKASLFSNVQILCHFLCAMLWVRHESTYETLCSLLLGYIVDVGTHCLVLPFKVKALINALTQFSAPSWGQPQYNGCWYGEYSIPLTPFRTHLRSRPSTRDCSSLGWGLSCNHIQVQPRAVPSLASLTPIQLFPKALPSKPPACQYPCPSRLPRNPN